jgi:Pectate lyase superfamily protein
MISRSDDIKTIARTSQICFRNCCSLCSLIDLRHVSHCQDKGNFTFKRLSFTIVICLSSILPPLHPALACVVQILPNVVNETKSPNSILNCPIELQSRVADHNYVLVNKYLAGLAQAVADPNNIGRTLIVTDTQRVSSLIVPATMGLRIEQGGNIMVQLDAKLLIEGPFEAGLYRVFSGSGRVVFGRAAIDRCYPEWWRANTVPGQTDMTDALNRAIYAARRTAVVYLHSGLYLVSGKLLLYAGTQLEGTGYVNTVIEASNEFTGTAIISMAKNQTAQDLLLENFSVEGNGVGALVNGIELGTQGPGYQFMLASSIQNVMVSHCTGYGFYINSDVSEIRNVWSEFNHVGFYFTDANIYGYNVNAEYSDLQDIIIAAGNSQFYGIQIEGSNKQKPQPTVDAIDVRADQVGLFGVYVSYPVPRNAAIGISAGDHITAVNVTLGGTTDNPRYIIDDATSGVKIRNSIPRRAIGFYATPDGAPSTPGRY